VSQSVSLRAEQELDTTVAKHRDGGQAVYSLAMVLGIDLDLFLTGDSIYKSSIMATEGTNNETMGWA
jgi:hypothetical protein